LVLDLSHFFIVERVQGSPDVAKVEHRLTFTEHLQNDVSLVTDLEVLESFQVVDKHANILTAVAVNHIVDSLDVLP
jgi:hypothetical protein